MQIPDICMQDNSGSGGSQPQTSEPTYQGAAASASKVYAGRDLDSMEDRPKHLTLSPGGPGASALNQEPRIRAACVKQLSYSIITTILASLIFTLVVILEQVVQHIIVFL